MLYMYHGKASVLQDVVERGGAEQDCPHVRSRHPHARALADVLGKLSLPITVCPAESVGLRYIFY